MQFILGGLAGALLAEDPALATLPVSLAVLGSMLAAPPVAAIMGRFGRRTGFLVGVAAGTAGSALAAHAIVEADFTPQTPLAQPAGRSLPSTKPCQTLHCGSAWNVDLLSGGIGVQN